jgi:serine/threonine protein kinase/tetratricopeptide (TPR) repeat protein
VLPEEQFDADPTSGDGERTAETGFTPSTPETTRTVIGHYHLLQRIGEGGMGEVWLAEQKEPVRRRVALKLVKAGMNTREVMARFESERQALALMEHPAIAKVFDAGSTLDGAPYFAMEYVAGVPITEYCDNHRLSIPERLELFTQVCEGVRHAHQKAVIHRDLKPSNILVAEVDGKATPKIIDFGVAKALSQKLTAHTMFTRVGALIGTPEYMSPEQALSSGEDIDIRTDVYSLGIIFYELLAGAPPLELRKIAFDEFLRKLREEDPPKPSTKIRTQDAATSSELAEKRQTEPRALAKQIGGDLDAIALKALEKDRARRYGSVSDFAADIGRYLNHEAVLAVAPSVAYRARKFARRHRGALVTACAFVAVLVAAAVVSVRQSIRANREAAVAQAVSDFLRNDLLAQAGASTQSGPKTKPDPDLKVRTALDRAAQRIAGKFDKQPEVEAAIRDTMGQTYMDLGQYPEARTQLERALELRRHTLGAEDQKTLATARNLGNVALRQGKDAEAESILTNTVATQRRVLGAEHAETLASMIRLESVYEHETKYTQAEALAAQVVEMQRRKLGPENLSTLASMMSLALAYYDQGKYDQAEKLDNQIVESFRRVLGPEHPNTLGSMNNLALVYIGESKYAEAEALLSQTLDIKRRVLGPDHSDTLVTMNNLAGVYQEDGKYIRSEELISGALEIRRRVLGPEHPDTLESMHNLARVNYLQGRYEQAEAQFSRTVEMRRRVIGPEHAKTLLSMWMLAAVYAAQGKYARAEPLFKQTSETSRRVLGPEHPYTLGELGDFAFMYQQEGDYARAESVAAEVLTSRRHRSGSQNPNTVSSALDLGLACASEGKFTESEALAREALEFYQKEEPDDWQRYRAESVLGESLAGEKKFAEAEPLLSEGYQGMLARRDRIAIPDRYHLDRAREWLVQLYSAWGKPEKAAEWKKKQNS